MAGPVGSGPLAGPPAANFRRANAARLYISATGFRLKQLRNCLARSRARGLQGPDPPLSPHRIDELAGNPERAAQPCGA